MVMFCCSG